MSSVSRNTHIPRLPASRCCSMSSNWCANPGGCALWTAMSATSHRAVSVVISIFGYHGNLLKIFSGRRRGRGPFQPLGTPGIRASRRTVSHRPCQVDAWDQIADTQDRRARGRHYNEHLKLRRVYRVSTRHAEVSKHELWKESEVETHKYYQRRETRPAVGIKTPGNFRPPEVNSSQVSHHGAANHNVMEMGHDEIRAIQVYVGGERRMKQTREPSHGKEADKTQGVKHGSIVRNRSFVERGRPIENLHGGRNRYHETKHGESQAGVNRLAGDEHVMSPNQETNDSD